MFDQREEINLNNLDKLLIGLQSYDPPDQSDTQTRNGVLKESWVYFYFEHMMVEILYKLSIAIRNLHKTIFLSLGYFGVEQESFPELP